MDVLVIFERMMMLFAMMMLGYIAYKIKWVDDAGYDKISKLVVNVFNPALIINGAMTAGKAESSLIKENLFFVIVYFAILIAISYPIALLIRTKQTHKNIYQLMTIFSNVGFMGIPVVSSILGQECVIYVVFYMLIYNLLIYTVGISMAQRNIPKEERVSGLKGIINTGVVCSLLAIVVFATDIEFNSSVLTFFDYVGNATIPLSMMVIGISVARMPIKKVFSGARLYIYTFIKLLVIPILAAFLLKGLKQTDFIFEIFIIMFAMPVGSIVTMITKEYGADDTLSSRGIIITTVASIVTIPIVCMFL